MNMPTAGWETKPVIKIGEPVKLRGLTPITLSAYGLVLVVPVLAAVVVMSLWTVGFLPLLLPFAAITITAFLLPYGFGNPYLRKLFKDLKPSCDADEAFLVQVTLQPRIRSGFGGILEDADDIGWLSVSPSGLSFVGDRLRITVPWESVKAVTQLNVGLRGEKPGEAPG